MVRFRLSSPRRESANVPAASTPDSVRTGASATEAAITTLDSETEKISGFRKLFPVRPPDSKKLLKSQVETLSDENAQLQAQLEEKRAQLVALEMEIHELKCAAVMRMQKSDAVPEPTPASQAPAQAPPPEAPRRCNCIDGALRTYNEVVARISRKSVPDLSTQAAVCATALQPPLQRQQSLRELEAAATSSVHYTAAVGLHEIVFISKLHRAVLRKRREKQNDNKFLGFIQIPGSAPSLPPHAAHFVGKWRTIRRENFDGFLRMQHFSWAIRKIAEKIIPEATWYVLEDVLHVDIVCPGARTMHKVMEEGEQDVVDPNSKVKYRVTTYWEGAQLCTSEFTPGGEYNSGNPIVCKRSVSNEGLLISVSPHHLSKFHPSLLTHTRPRALILPPTARMPARTYVSGVGAHTHSGT